ncbi:MAG: glycosyltransferase [Nitrospiraceae bacterium]|nr:glycosyltransferase [Nitrospiraceae bacterium]
MRGGERCLEVFCELFPDAPIFTLLHRSGTVSPAIEKHRIHTSFLQHLPFSHSHYRNYLPLFPRAIESFRLSGFDLILSSSHCVAKGIRPSTGTCHVSYVFTPMRYVWDQYDSYFAKGRAGLPTRASMRLLRRGLQKWDIASSKRVHYFIAISHHVAERIRRYYGRKADVVYPPVDFDAFSVSERHDGFYLMVTAFAPYKRVDLAIDAFNALKKPLKIIGTGQEEKRLKTLAGPTIEFLGWQSDDLVRQYYGRCKALIFPGEEDFGIVPLEAMATGKPVIAFGKGGVLETVVPFNNPGSKISTGVLFSEQTAEALRQAVQLFERRHDAFDPHGIRTHVASFGREHFKTRIQALIDTRYQEFRLGHHAQTS